MLFKSLGNKRHNNYLMYSYYDATMFKYIIITGINSVPGVQWRDPDLHEVIEFLSNPNSVIKVLISLITSCSFQIPGGGGWWLVTGFINWSISRRMLVHTFSISAIWTTRWRLRRGSWAVYHPLFHFLTMIYQRFTGMLAEHLGTVIALDICNNY